jgi:antitoxin (DNA-binding transcriptional repressor) of toxin-antitoxin stability system
MTTLSPTQARKNLTGWLKKAAAGENIGILYGDKVFAIRPVKVEAKSYAEKEYGVTKAELKRFAQRLHAQGVKDRKAGKSRVFNGDIEALLKD